MARKRYKGHRQSEKREGGGFVAFPHVVLRHPAFVSLDAYAVKLLLDVAAQYNGENNGDLCAAWSLMKARGWRSKATLAKAIKGLVETEFLVVSRQGGKHKASLYALTWFEIDYCDGKLDISAPTQTFMGAWRREWDRRSSGLHTKSAPPTELPLPRLTHVAGQAAQI